MVREAFRRRGYDAWSCDLLPSEIRGQHIEGDVRRVLDWGWDLMVAHPPCTHLAVSGARWFKDKGFEQENALEFVRTLLAAPIPYIALENPVSVISSRIRKPDQITQPWWFGHGETKATCWWLKNLPQLRPTNVVDGRAGRVWKAVALAESLEGTQPHSGRRGRCHRRAVGRCGGGSDCSLIRHIRTAAG